MDKYHTLNGIKPLFNPGGPGEVTSKLATILTKLSSKEAIFRVEGQNCEGANSPPHDHNFLSENVFECPGSGPTPGASQNVMIDSSASSVGPNMETGPIIFKTRMHQTFLDYLLLVIPLLEDRKIIIV